MGVGAGCYQNSYQANIIDSMFNIKLLCLAWVHGIIV